MNKPLEDYQLEGVQGSSISPQREMTIAEQLAKVIHQLTMITNKIEAQNLRDQGQKLMQEAKRLEIQGR